MKKVAALSALAALVGVIGYIGLTAFTKTSVAAPVQNTVAQAAARLTAHVMQGQTGIQLGTKCLVVKDGKPVATRSGAARSEDFACVVAVVTTADGKLVQCEGVSFSYPPGASDVKITAAQAIPAKYCA